MKCETCGDKALYYQGYYTRDLRVRVYRCAAQHKTKVFVKGLPRNHDQEAHIRKIKEIIAGRYVPAVPKLRKTRDPGGTQQLGRGKGSGDKG